MEHLKYIKGMDSLIQELPAKYLPLFGNILKLEYLKEFELATTVKKILSKL